MIDSKAKRLLAAAAAKAVFDNRSSVSSRSKGEMTRQELLDAADIGFGEIDPRLERLVEGGYLRKRNTGYYGYGDHYVDGVDVWAITHKGLMFLWV